MDWANTSARLNDNNILLFLTSYIWDLTLWLFEEHILFQVFDQLNTVGVCLSYVQSLHVTKLIGGHFGDILCKAAQENKSIRLIGDNLNFLEDVKQESISHRSHMVHMFASCALVSERYFSGKPNVPEIPRADLAAHHVLPSVQEYQTMQQDCIAIVGKIISKFLPQMSFMDNILEQNFIQPENTKFRHKTQVIPLPVLPLNEQKY